MEETAERWKQVKGTCPMSRKKRGPKVKQRSYVHAHPKHLLAGLMRCRSCGGAVVLLSGKGSGYYGCYNGRRETCTNRLKVPRRRAEDAILSDLKELLGTIELEPVTEKESDVSWIVNGEKEFKPYYVAHTKVQSLALLRDGSVDYLLTQPFDNGKGEDEETAEDSKAGGAKGANCRRWWTRWDLNPRPHPCEGCALPAELLARSPFTPDLCRAFGRRAISRSALSACCCCCCCCCYLAALDPLLYGTHLWQAVHRIALGPSAETAECLDPLETLQDIAVLAAHGTRSQAPVL